MLVKTIDEVREVANVPLALELDSLKNDIEECEVKYLIAVLGKTLYESLESAYQADQMDEVANAHLKKLLPYAQRIIVNLAIAEAIDFLQVQITDSGVQRIEKSDEKAAFQYQKLDAQDYYARRGFTGVERTLLFLEENIAQYESWKTSLAYTRHKQMFIPDALSFNEYHSIDESRRTYNALLPIMRRVEEFKIRETIGLELYAELKAEMTNPATELKPENKTLIETYIRPAVAHFTIAAGVQELSMKFTPVGVIVSDQLAIAPSSQQKKQVPDDRLEKLAIRSTGSAEQYLKKVKEYLLENASAEKFKAFYDSALYPKPEKVEDRPKSKIYGAL